MPKELVKPSDSEMCPPGYFVVHGHSRTCASGAVTWVDTHLRHRDHVKSGLLRENIPFLYWNSKKEYPKLDPVFGFKSGSEYDPPIQFWLDYWKEQGSPFPADIDPMLIKILIAIESGFNEKAKSSGKNSTAAGLMQVTNKTLRVLGGFQNKHHWAEVKNNLIRVKSQDMLEPVINIAVGIRLLSHKYNQIPKGNTKNLKNTLKNYYSRNDDGTLYAEKILALYEKSKPDKTK